MNVHLCAARLANHGFSQHIRAGWICDKRGSLPQNAVAVGCSERRVYLASVQSLMEASFVRHRTRLRISVVRQIFRSFRLDALKGLLRKTYIQECHVAVTTHSWRPKVA